jgi:hypothetical protein
MAFRFTSGLLSAAAAAVLNAFADRLGRLERLTVAPPLAITEAGGNKVISYPAATTGSTVVFVRPTGAISSGRYPGYLQTYSVDANTWADVTSPAVWLVEPNGGALPSDNADHTSWLTAYRVPCVYAGRLAADGLAVYLALVPPGVMADWKCVDGTPQNTYTPV